MPDIAMCMSATCPMEETCYRHSASGTKPSDYQSMCDFNHTDDGCEHYWEKEDDD